MCANKINRREEVISLFNQGYSPKEISQKIRNISFKRVMDFLYMQAGERNIRLSDIWFSINHNIRAAVEKYDTAKEGNSEEEEIKTLVELADLYMIHKDEVSLFLKLKKKRVTYGDMYELISEIELLLHRTIKNVLIKNYGKEWWIQVVPQKVREKCEDMYNKDTYRAKEPFSYTSFIDLKILFKKLWSQFENILPIDIVNDKKVFLTKLVRINRIRNGVMHPIKEYKLTSDDFDFVYEFHAAIDLDNWQEKEIAE